MRFQFRILLLANLVFTLCSHGQERFIIKGEVLDIETKKPVPGVNVILRGEKKGTITDSAGSFRLELPAREQHVVVFSHVAYQKVIRSVFLENPKEIEFRIHMLPEPIALKEFVVTGNRPFTVNRALMRVDGAEFERLGENDMERAMQYLLPTVVKPLVDRMMKPEMDFTLYVNGEWKESILLREIDPFSIRQVLVWNNPLASAQNLEDPDFYPIGLPLRRGKCVILIDTK